MASHYKALSGTATCIKLLTITKPKWKPSLEVQTDLKQQLLTSKLLSSCQSSRAVIAFILAKRGTAFSLNAVSWRGGSGSLLGRCKKASMQHILITHKASISSPWRIQPFPGPLVTPCLPGKWWEPSWTKMPETVPSQGHGTMGRDREDKMQLSAAASVVMGRWWAGGSGTHSVTTLGERAHSYWGITCSFPSILEHKCHEQFSFKPQCRTRHREYQAAVFYFDSALLLRSPGDFLDKPASLFPRE